MKTVILDLSGDYYPGDFVAINHVSRSGGRNTAKLRVEVPLTAKAVVNLLAYDINGGVSEWNPGHFQASSDANNLVIMCNEDAGAVEIVGSVESKSGIRNFPVVVL